MSFFNRRGNSSAQEERQVIANNDEVSPEPVNEAPVVDTQGQIALTAYYRWLARGGVDGNDQQDWFEAEGAHSTPPKG